MISTRGRFRGRFCGWFRRPAEPVTLAAPPSTGLFRWLLRQNVGWLSWGLGVVLLWRVSVFLVPLGLGRAIDSGVVAGDQVAGLGWVGVTLALALAEAGLSAGRHWVHDVSLHTATVRLRRRLVAALQSIDARWYAGRPRGEIVSLIYNDAQAACQFVEPLLRMASAALVFVVVGVLLVALSPALAVTALVAVPAVALSIRLGAPRIRTRVTALQESTATMLGRLEEIIVGIAAVKSLGAQDAVAGSLDAASGEVGRRALRVQRARATVDIFTRLGPTLSVAIGIAIGGREVVDGELSLGEFTAFVTWMGLLAGVTNELTGRLSALISCFASCRRLERMLEHRRREPGDRATAPIGPTMAVENLTIRLGGDHPVLDGASMSVEPGERVAVVGRTGSGKSSLLKGMAGLLEPSAGLVTLDGTELHRYSSAAQRATVSLVPEDAFCFDDSVRANLRFGGASVTSQQLWAALRLAGLDDLVRELPQGLATRLGNGGRMLSGGEAQRLCLARALLRRPAVLLLDDSLSAVDADTEARIIANLRDWPGTVVFTTHRPGMLRFATRVVRVRDGGVEQIAASDTAPADLSRGEVASDSADACTGERGADGDVASLASGRDVAGVLRRAWPQLRPFTRRIFAGSLLSLLAMLLLVVQPQAIRVAVDRGIAAGDLGVLTWAGVAYAALGIAATLASVGFVHVAGGASQSALHSIRLRTWRALLRQPLRFHAARGTGELVARATGDVQNLSTFVRDGLTGVLGSVFLLVAGLAFMIGSSWQLTVTAVAAVPVPLLFLQRYARRSPRYYAAMTQASARQMNVANQAVAGLMATQAAVGGGEYAGRMFRRATHAFLRRAVAVVRMENRFFLPVEFASAAVVGVVAGVGIVLVNRGVTTAGTLIAFLSYVTLIQQPIGALTALLGTVQTTRVSLARLLSIQGLPAGDDSDAAPDAVAPTRNRVSGALLVEGLSFAYPGARPVLRNVHMRAEPGARTAIIGPTGAGKSTLAKLIAGLDTPTGGAVTLGGVDLVGLPGRARQRAVMYLPQGGQLFSGTVADNLRLARPDASDTDLVAAFAQLGLDDLLARLPQGIDTPVGGHGGRLSAGERQLVWLAHVVLRDPAVVVLDESTSRVDDETVARVDAALRRLSARRCLVMITHRPTTIASADVVYRLDDGMLRPVPRAPDTSDPR